MASDDKDRSGGGVFGAIRRFSSKSREALRKRVSTGGRQSPARQSVRDAVPSTQYADWTEDAAAQYIDSMQIDGFEGLTPAQCAITRQLLAQSLTSVGMPAPWAFAGCDADGQLLFVANGAYSYTHPLKSTVLELASICAHVLKMGKSGQRHEGEQWLRGLHAQWNSEAEALQTKWLPAEHENGQQYFYHSETRETMWENPALSILPFYFLRLDAIQRLLDRCMLMTPTQSGDQSGDTEGRSAELAPDVEVEKVGTSQDMWTEEECTQFFTSVTTCSQEETLLLRILVDSIRNVALPTPWTITRSHQGEIRFVNTATEEESSQHPLCYVFAEIASTCRECMALPASERNARAVELSQSCRDARDAEIAKWAQLESDGRIYFAHTETRQTTWEQPDRIVSPAYDFKLGALSLMQTLAPPEHNNLPELSGIDDKSLPQNLAGDAQHQDERQLSSSSIADKNSGSGVAGSTTVDCSVDSPTLSATTTSQTPHSREDVGTGTFSVDKLQAIRTEREKADVEIIKGDAPLQKNDALPFEVLMKLGKEDAGDVDRLPNDHITSQEGRDTEVKTSTAANESSNDFASHSSSDRNGGLSVENLLKPEIYALRLGLQVDDSSSNFVDAWILERISPALHLTLPTPWSVQRDAERVFYMHAGFDPPVVSYEHPMQAVHLKMFEALREAWASDGQRTQESTQNALTKLLQEIVSRKFLKDFGVWQEAVATPRNVLMHGGEANTPATMYVDRANGRRRYDDPRLEATSQVGLALIALRCIWGEELEQFPLSDSEIWSVAEQLSSVVIRKSRGSPLTVHSHQAGKDQQLEEEIAGGSNDGKSENTQEGVAREVEDAPPQKPFVVHVVTSEDSAPNGIASLDSSDARMVQANGSQHGASSSVQNCSRLLAPTAHLRNNFDLSTEADGQNHRSWVSPDTPQSAFGRLGEKPQDMDVDDSATSASEPLLASRRVRPVSCDRRRYRDKLYAKYCSKETRRGQLDPQVQDEQLAFQLEMRKIINEQQQVLESLSQERERQHNEQVRLAEERQADEEEHKALWAAIQSQNAELEVIQRHLSLAECHMDENSLASKGPAVVPDSTQQFLSAEIADSALDISTTSASTLSPPVLPTSLPQPPQSALPQVQ